MDSNQRGNLVDPRVVEVCTWVCYSIKGCVGSRDNEKNGERESSFCLFRYNKAAVCMGQAVNDDDDMKITRDA